MAESNPSVNGHSKESLRQCALEGLCWKLAHDNIGIYPMSVHGEGGYKKRTEKMEGWNECAIEHSKNYMAAMRWLEALPAEHKTLVEDLLIADKLELSVRGDKLQTWVICNDLFFWGCADGEDISLDELPALAECLKLSSDFGGDLWCCRKREMRPQAAIYKYFSPSEILLFDAAGPERTDPDGRKRSAKPPLERDESKAEPLADTPPASEASPERKL